MTLDWVPFGYAMALLLASLGIGGVSGFVIGCLVVQERKSRSATNLPTTNLPKDESGQSYTIMLLLLLPLLLLFLAAVHDLGNTAAGVVIAQNAADLGAQEAGKLIDVDHFMQWQEVRLRPEAILVAQQIADDLTGGAFHVDAVYVEGNVVHVEGRVGVRTPFLDAFVGIERIVRPVTGTAEAAHGAERAGE